MLKRTYPQVGRDAPEAVKARSITKTLNESGHTLVWFIYGWQQGEWKLITGSDNSEKTREIRLYHESKNRKVRIYGCDISKRSSRLVYETPEK